jgi:transcriptional regulator with XRE-family HTH domain
MRQLEPEFSAAIAEDRPKLGVQLRHARLLRGLRLKDVAEMSGYSESLISKIETDKAIPSLNTLHRLAKALGTSIGALFDTCPATARVVSRPSERLSMGVGEDGTETEMLVPFGASKLVQALIVRVHPGGHSGGLRHHQGEEVGYMTGGELIFSIAGKNYHLRKGDSFYFPSHLPHGFRNPGTEIAEVIWFNTPATL